MSELLMEETVEGEGKEGRRELRLVICTGEENEPTKKAENKSSARERVRESGRAEKKVPVGGRDGG